MPPVFLLGQTYQHRDLLQPVGQAREGEQETPPGLLLSWEHVPQRGVEDGRAEASPLEPILADPGACRFDRPKIGRVAAAPWVGRAQPSTEAEWDVTIAEALADQRTLGVDSLIVPGKTLHQTDFPDGLQDALDAARRSHKGRLTTDPEWMVRACIDEVWLTNRALRRTLLNQLTDLPDDLGVALHVQWSKGAHPDGELLQGLKMVVTALASDGRRVLIIESGLVGWLSIGWGAWGFTAGVARSSWHRSTEVVRRNRPAPRVEWYFERQLLHQLRRSTHQRIAVSPRYQQCICTFCQQLISSGGGAWDASLASQHALHALSVLTDSVAAPQLAERRERIAALLEGARDLAAHLQLRGEARPAHINAWLTHL